MKLNLVAAGTQKLTGAQRTRSKRQEVVADHDGLCHGDLGDHDGHSHGNPGDNGGHSDEDRGGDGSLAPGLAWAFQCDVSKREEVAEMAR